MPKIKDKTSTEITDLRDEMNKGFAELQEHIRAVGIRVDDAAEKDKPDIEGYFGLCPICHKDEECLNVGRTHWCVCHEHKVKWCIGDNLFSTWQDESPETHAENKKLLDGYSEVTPHIALPDCVFISSENRLTTDNTFTVSRYHMTGITETATFDNMATAITCAALMAEKYGDIPAINLLREPDKHMKGGFSRSLDDDHPF